MVLARSHVVTINEQLDLYRVVVGADVANRAAGRTRPRARRRDIPGARGHRSGHRCIGELVERELDLSCIQLAAEIAVSRFLNDGR